MDAAAILAKLLDTLWLRYKEHVPYAARYQKMVEERGGKIQNDHVAFRTFNTDIGGQPAGVEGLSRIFEPLGYVRKDKYPFEDKKLTAWHWEHGTNTDNPKLFISQLEVDRLSATAAKLIKESVTGAPDLLSPTDHAQLNVLAKGGGTDDYKGAALVNRLAGVFTRPWLPPKRSVIAPVNEESQYAAWTLLHGNAVNHFTAYINHQRVRDWPDLETTVNALREAGLPMKDEMEGERGSKLRQSSTQAADMECEVIEVNGSIGKIPWSYAYYELAERGFVQGPESKPVIFQGFLGAQATNLFEMTKRS